MEKIESCVPPGFRFHPTDEELVGYYLMKKITLQKIDLDVIRDIDLYKIEPWDLQERCRIGHEEETEWYFFSHKDKKYPTGTRTNRATFAGFWKATGRDKAVYDKKKLLIGMRKTLVFYKGRAPNGQKTDWIIHEYRAESDENALPQEEGWVICRAFKKRTINQPKTLNINSWNSPYTNFNNIQSHPVQYKYHTIHPQSNLLRKQESELEALRNLLKHTNNGTDNVIKLPKLESPELLMEKKQGDKDREGQAEVTDWRALDKFVASQLSHGDEIELFTGLIGPKGNDHDHHMATMVSLLQEDELDGKFCMFEK